MRKKFLLSIVCSLNLLLAHTDDPLVKPEDPLFSFKEDRLHFYGDARIRHQRVERTDKANKYQGRYRIRLGSSYDISDNTVFEIQTSSGRGNPTSGNVKMDDGIDINKFKLDILDIDYKFDKSRIKVGRSKYVIYRPIKTQLIWDNDIRLNGVLYGYKEGSRFTIGVAQVDRLELKTNPLSSDIYMINTQYVHQIKASEKTFNLGTGIYHYEGVKGNTAPYAKGALGNSYGDEGYEHDYTILDLSAEAQFKNVLGKPLKIASSFAYNMAVDGHNFAYDISAKLGSTKKNYDWQLGYTYRDIQRDAVFAAHNDSDFIAGGTDGRGHIITTKMRIAKNMDIAGHFQWAKKFTDSQKDEADYNRIMLDMIVKF